MAQQTQTTYRRTAMLDKRQVATPVPGNQPIFYFDGDFRTWEQVQRRAQLNRAIIAHITR